MSAIFGIFQRTGQPAERQHLERMSTALADFGRDGGGIWVSGAVGLGQRQMAFTPEDRFERQPLADSQENLVLVCDGRIDNRPELQAELDLPAAAGTTPDSEYVLCAYQKWGRGCAAHLVGVFAFALWDAQRQELFLARSPISAPALVYYESSTVFAFASMPRGLHALPFIPRLLDERHAAGRLTWLGGEPNATLYQQINTLPTGQWMSVSAGRVETANYWQPDLECTLRYADEQEYLREFRRLLERAVSDALRGSTGAGVMLSGGLDSASIGAIAARQMANQGRKLATFTEAPREGFAGAIVPGRYADETALVKTLAGLYPNIEMQVLRTPGGFFLDEIENLFRYLEMPFTNTSNRVWYEAILQTAAHQGVHSVLGGEIGNLTISWAGSGLLTELLRQKHLRQAWQQAGLIDATGQFGGQVRTLLGKGILPLLPVSVWTFWQQIRQPNSLSVQHIIENSSINPKLAADLHLTEDYQERTLSRRYRPDANSRQLRFKSLNLMDGGMYFSAYRAMFGLNLGAPLADVRLAEFCLALPEKQFLWDGEDRRLVRRAMADLLPAEILANRRRGLQAADWFERLHAARPQVTETLGRLEHNTLASRMLNLPKLRQLLAEMPPIDEPDFAKISDYRMKFEPALMWGRFLAWFEEGQI